MRSAGGWVERHTQMNQVIPKWMIPGEVGVSNEAFAAQVARLEEVERPRLQRLWAYYRNPMLPAAVADAGSCGVGIVAAHA